MEQPTRLGDITARYEAMSNARARTLHAIYCGLAAASHGAVSMLDLARQNPTLRSHMPLFEKAAIGALVGTDQGLDVLRPLGTAWSDLIRRPTYIARMTGVRFVPPILPITVVDAGQVATFVTENDPIPVARPTLTDVSQQVGKIAAITPYSAEALRKSADKLAVLVERDQARAVATRENIAVVDGLAAVTGGRPASILHNKSALGGGSPSDIEADVFALFEEVLDGEAAEPHFLTSTLGALYLAKQRDNGVRLFPNVSAKGGDILGVPVLVAAGVRDVLCLVDADSLLVADEGATIDIATAASFQFDGAPLSGAQSGVSLFQTDAIGVRTQRFISWALARSNAAAYIDLPV